MTSTLDRDVTLHRANRQHQWEKSNVDGVDYCARCGQTIEGVRDANGNYRPCPGFVR